MRKLASTVLLSAIVTMSCDHYVCEPVLCIEGNCGTAGSMTLAEGEGIVISYLLPVGVDDKDVAFRIETPCACATFSRPTAAPDTSDDLPETVGQDGDTCDVASAVQIPIVVPPGGGCRFAVTARFANDARTLVVPGSGCEQLTCASDVACTAGLPATAGGAGGGGEDGAGAG